MFETMRTPSTVAGTERKPSLIDLRLGLLANGYPLVPIDGPNVEVLTGEVVGIGIDVPEATLASEVEALAVSLLGETPLRRVGNAPRLLLCFRTEHPFRKMAAPVFLVGGTKAQVEVLGVGQQFVARGVHPETRKRYGWPLAAPEQVPLADLPRVTEDAVRGFVAAAEAVFRQAGGLARKELDARDHPGAVRTKGPTKAGGGPPYGIRVLEEGCQAPAPCSGHAAPDAATKTERTTTPPRVPASAGAGGELPPGINASEYRESVEADRPEAGPRSGGDRGRAAETGASQWPTPLDFGSDAVTEAPVLMPFHVPAALWDFASDTGVRMGVDPAAVAMCGATACASVITDDWGIQSKRHDPTWLDCARLWTALLAPPSYLKSPVIGATTKPIDKLENAARALHQKEMREYKEAHGKWSGKKGESPEPARPKLARYMIEGATVEAITEILRDDDAATQHAPARKVLSRQDEMSEWLGNLDRYAAGGKGGGDKGAYIRLYNGGRYTHDRVGRGTFAMPNWSACFVGGMQPAIIRKMAKDMPEDGLTARFTWIVPGIQCGGVDRPPDRQAIARYENLFPALLALRPPASPDGDGFQHVTLAEGAQQHREDILTAVRALSGTPDASTQLTSALGKWPGLFARLCLTFHLVNLADAVPRGSPGPDAMVVPEGTARMVADFMLDILLPHLLRAEAAMFNTNQMGHARWIAGLILANGMTRITTRDVTRAYRPLKEPERRDDLAAVMASLVAVGWLEPQAPENPVKPAWAWSVNPAVHVMYEGRGRIERGKRDEARAGIAAYVEVVRRRKAAQRA